MNSRLLLTDISNALAADKGITKRKAEIVARAMFEVIEEGLLRDQIVKVKGLGTFKLIVVSPRESVSVNTGKRIQIESYTKVTFTPEKQIAELVNRPFRDFETVQLNAATPLAELEAVDKTQVAAPAAVPPAPAAEVPAPPAAPVAAPPAPAGEVPAPPAPPVAATPAPAAEVPAPPASPVAATSAPAAEVPAPPASSVAATPAPAAEVPAPPASSVAATPAPAVEVPAPPASSVAASSAPVVEEPHKSKSWGKKVMLLAVCAAAIALVALIFKPSEKSAADGQPQTQTAQRVQSEQETQMETPSPATPSAAEATPTVSPTSTPAGHFYIILATGTTKELGESFIKELQAKGFPDARLQEDDYLRVVYGDFPDSHSAEEMRDRLKVEAGIKEALIEEAK